MLQELQQDRNRALKKAQEAVSDAKEEGRALTADERSTYDDWMAEVEDLNEQIQEAKRDQERFERLDEYDDQLDEPAREPVARDAFEGGGGEGREGESRDEWRSAFKRYLKNGRSGLSRDEFRTLTDHVPGYEARESDVVTSTSNVGGLLVPTDVEDRLFEELKDFGGILEAVNAAPGDPIDFPWMTDSGNPIEVPIMDDTANQAGNVSEGSSISSVSDLSLANRTFHAQVYQSGPLAISIEMMDDSVIAPEELVRSAITNRIGRAWAANLIASTNTTSSTEVQGLITASTGAVHTGGSSSTSLSFDDLYDLKYAVDPAHRNRDRRWLFTNDTFKAIAKLTDGNGRYLLQPNQQEGAEGLTLLGDPTHIDNSSTDIEFGAGSSGSKPVWYGNFGRFGIRRIRGMTVQTLNELFALQRKVGFVGFVRVDARVMQSTGLSADQRPIRCIRSS